MGTTVYILGCETRMLEYCGLLLGALEYRSPSFLIAFHLEGTKFIISNELVDLKRYKPAQIYVFRTVRIFMTFNLCITFHFQISNCPPFGSSW